MNQKRNEVAITLFREYGRSNKMIILLEYNSISVNSIFDQKTKTILQPHNYTITQSTLHYLYVLVRSHFYMSVCIFAPRISMEIIWFFSALLYFIIYVANKSDSQQITKNFLSFVSCYTVFFSSTFSTKTEIFRGIVTNVLTKNFGLSRPKNSGKHASKFSLVGTNY
jgi:hypothetical protein